VLGLAPHAAALRKVKVRSADRDVLAVRQRVERALAAVDWTAPGLPPGAILLVRRLVPVPGEGAMARRSFGERVCLALREQVRRARRPWLQADVLDAEAVVFVDEAELMACLARDWLRGVVAQRWWWRSVLGDANPQAWLRREVIARPDVLVPAISLLALHGEAAPFVARLDPVDCEQAFEAVVRSHAVPRARAPAGDAAPEMTPPARDVSGIRVEDAVAAAPAEPLRRLVTEAPELRLARSNPAQRRLLALVLALIRAPTWARTEPFAAALEALDPMGADELAHGAPLPPDSPRDRSAARAVTEPVAASVPRPVAAPAGGGETAPLPDAPAINTPTPRPAVSMEMSARFRIGTDGVDGAPEVRESVPRHEGAAEESRPVDAANGVVPNFDGNERIAAAAYLETSVAPAASAITSSLEMAPRVETQFGGLFYLLNAALAMGFYGDFTAPLARNLELSPWDWLALVGRAWFGTDLREDPVWNLLAGLAGRTPEEEPDRDFHPPSEDWLEGHLAVLRGRLALALAAGEGVDVPDLVCRHPAQIEVSATTVHVHLALAALAALDLAIRIAGLDRDPGWIPAAGRTVRFHFD